MDTRDFVLVRGNGPDDGNKCIPYGLLGLGQYASKHGFSYEIIDRHLFPEAITKTLCRIAELHPRVVGFSAMAAQFDDAMKVAVQLRESGYDGKIVFGGPHVTPCPDAAKAIADTVVRKEGESEMLNILKGHTTESRIIDGVALETLDEIPLPDVDLLRTLHHPEARHFNIISARGCPFSCSFCLGPDQRERRMRYHSIEYTLELIRRIVAAQPLRRMFIMDDIFALKKSRVLEFCEALHKEEFKLVWHCFGHATCGDAEMFAAMKDAGCEMISLGVESGSPEILEQNHKNITLDQIRAKVREICGAGMVVQTQFLFGLIGDTEETMRQTIDFARELNQIGASPSCGYVQPYPGSEIYNRAHECGRYLKAHPRLRIRKAISYLPKGVSLRTYLHLHRDFELATRGRYKRNWRNRMRCHLEHSLALFYWRSVKGWTHMAVDAMRKTLRLSQQEGTAEC